MFRDQFAETSNFQMSLVMFVLQRSKHVQVRSCSDQMVHDQWATFWATRNGDVPSAFCCLKSKKISNRPGFAC